MVSTNYSGRAELRTFSLLGVVIAALYGVVGSIGISLVVSAGLTWLYFSSLRQSTSAVALSAARFYGPIYLIYNGVSLFAPDLEFSQEISLMYLGSLLGFLFGWAIVSIAPCERFVSPALDAKEGRTVFRRGGVAFVLLITAFTFLYAMGKAGGIPALSSNPNVARVTFFDNGVVSTIIVIGTHVLIAAGLIDSFLLKGIRAKLVPLSFLAFGLGLALAMSNRGLAINPLVFGLFVVFWMRNHSVRALLPWGILGLCAVGVAGYVRNLGSWGTSYVSDLSAQGYSGLGTYLAPVFTYIFGTAQTFARSIDYFPNREPYQLGLQFFSPLIHGESVDLYLKNLFGLDFEGFGLALGSANAFYVDWGPLGVVLGHAVFGLLVAIVYQQARFSKSQRWIVFYCYLLMQLIFSNYGHPFAYLYYILEPIVLTVLIVPRRDEYFNPRTRATEPFRDSSLTGGPMANVIKR